MPRRKRKGLSFYHRRKKISSSTVREIFSWLFGILVSVFIAFVLVYFVGMTTRVIGVSMEPTIDNGEKVYINRIAYLLSSPKVGDVVVFLPNGNENSHYYVKRVVAKPGDAVQIVGGRLYVNNVMEENTEVIFDKMADAGIAETPILLGRDEYFVLGDNRNNSEDSRAANIGPIEKKHILGEAWFHSNGTLEGTGFVK
ncbi:MAG: signal peptidase I [Lachnospiraceae bacterium]|nr:signal peptidase I [Lachnospiraceae bacterium]